MPLFKKKIGQVEGVVNSYKKNNHRFKINFIYFFFPSILLHFLKRIILYCFYLELLYVDITWCHERKLCSFQFF